MKVYVVLEEDRGCGVFVAGVFASLAAADAYLSGPEGSNCYLDSKCGIEVQFDSDTREFADRGIKKTRAAIAKAGGENDAD